MDDGGWDRLKQDVVDQLSGRAGDVRIYPLVDKRPKTKTGFSDRFAATWHRLVEGSRNGSKYDHPVTWKICSLWVRTCSLWFACGGTVVRYVVTVVILCSLWWRHRGVLRSLWCRCGETVVSGMTL